MLGGLCKDVMKNSFTIYKRDGKRKDRETGGGRGFEEEKQIFPKFDIRLRLFKQNEWLKKVYFEG